MKSFIFILSGFISVSAQAAYKCSTFCADLERHTLSIAVSGGPVFHEFEAACDAHNAGAYAAGGSYMACEWTERTVGKYVENTREWNSRDLADQELNRLCGPYGVGSDKDVQWPNWAEYIVTYSGAGTINCNQ
jgi:hypothetical protein